MKKLFKLLLPVLFILASCDKKESTNAPDENPISEDSEKYPEESDILLFEPALYRAFLSQKIETLSAEIKALKEKEQPSEEDKEKMDELEGEKKSAQRESEGLDCDEALGISCEELYQAQMVARFLQTYRVKPRDCPNEENCLPLDAIRYLLVNEKFKEFKPVFLDENGKEVGKIGKEILTFKGLEGYYAVPVSFEGIEGNTQINITRPEEAGDGTVTYDLTVPKP